MDAKQDRRSILSDEMISPDSRPVIKEIFTISGVYYLPQLIKEVFIYPVLKIKLVFLSEQK